MSGSQICKIKGFSVKEKTQEITKEFTNPMMSQTNSAAFLGYLEDLHHNLQKQVVKDQTKVNKEDLQPLSNKRTP